MRPAMSISKRSNGPSSAAAPAGHGPGGAATSLLPAMQLAFAAFERGDDAEAERLCRAVLAARANYFDALHMLGVMAAKAGRAEEAVAVLAKAIAAKPSSAEAHNNRGNALDDLGHCGEALQSYERALALRPDFADAHYNRGNALQNLNRHA